MAFQCKLALEEHFHGQPRCDTSRQYSISLGTQGFFGLALHSSASAGLVPPPLWHFIREMKQQNRVGRMFLFSDSLSAAPAVIGRELVLILIKDVYRRNLDVPVEELKDKAKPLMVVDSIEYMAFTKSVADDMGHFKFPCVLQRAHAMVTHLGKDFSSMRDWHPWGSNASPGCGSMRGGAGGSTGTCFPLWNCLKILLRGPCPPPSLL